MAVGCAGESRVNSLNGGMLGRIESCTVFSRTLHITPWMARELTRGSTGKNGSMETVLVGLQMRSL